jgi:hypothetical protein
MIGGDPPGGETVTPVPLGSLALTFDKFRVPEKPDETGVINRLTRGPSGIESWVRPLRTMRRMAGVTSALLTVLEALEALDPAEAANDITEESKVISN